MFKAISSIYCNVSKVTNIRQYGKHNKKYLYKDGAKVQNIMYYPGENCPLNLHKTTEKYKLFEVRRIKSLKGCPYWEKRILRDLDLYDSNAIAVVKNIPENNARLWKVKHLIKVSPIRFPFGEPTESDINYTFINENGDCVVVKEIRTRTTRDNRMEAAIDFTKNQERMDGETLQKDSRLKWQNTW
ncbi:uncharacterized protein LOC131435166 [Malaya genurostris]|uniref:uncharacterized protein LOC131435166 n=1 Tax=Malaya genurostris TaxID=325434 RepID=UPI0026F3CF85|nr:uncharacterized protein LOC131435166 [Malaya genurostris]